MSKLINNYSIGSDPELFFRSLETGKFVPSFYVMKGDKYAPIPISDKGHMISCDNVMCEYGIPPCTTAEEWVKEHLFVQDYIKRTIAEPNNLELVIFPFAEFDKNDLRSRAAKAFGCDPDFNVYNNNEANKVGKAGLTGRCSGKIVCHLN